MRNRILIDSSFLYALYNQKDEDYKNTQAFAQTNKSLFVIPEVTLPEVTFLFNRAGGVPAVVQFLETLANEQAGFEHLTVPDITRAHEIMAKYSKARFDFVDCCIMALSERLNITQVCTFDHRDFSIYRPTHCAFLELLP